MIRQGHISIAGVLRRGAAPALEALLASMNGASGQASPGNLLVPFGQLKQLHVARFVILDDPSLPDREIAPSLPVREPLRLAFIADFDGKEEDLLRDLLRVAAPGLSQIFAHCIDFEDGGDIGQWLRSHRLKSAANYVNWPGRSTGQLREEIALHKALRAARINHPDANPEALWPTLREAGRFVSLSPLPRRSFWQWLGDSLHLLHLPALVLLLSPMLIVALPFLAILLRRREVRDEVIAPVPSPIRNTLLSAQEDHDITNQYSAIGSLKPGVFRRWLTVVILWAIHWAARHLFTKGRLGRVNTIQFASWTFLDNKRRLYFASNYDGSREAYNDDFINKVAFGLNLSFSNGLGYPRTRWLIFDGARHEQDFKWYLFHHQIPTQVWYKAFPGLSNYDMARNARIRKGFQSRLTGKALRRWIAEI